MARPENGCLAMNFENNSGQMLHNPGVEGS
jgi:hypothetical protein